MHKLKLDHLTEKVDKGFDDVRDQIKSLRQDIKDSRGLTIG